MSACARFTLQIAEATIAGCGYVVKWLPEPPSGTCHAQAGIDVTGVLAVDVAEHAGETISIARHRNAMNMVRHQAIRPYFDSRTQRPSASKSRYSS